MSRTRRFTFFVLALLFCGGSLAFAYHRMGASGARLLDEARSAVDAEEYAAAERIAREAANSWHRPTARQGRLILARAQLHQGRFDSVQANLSRLRGDVATSHEAVLLRGEVELGLQRPLEAER